MTLSLSLSLASRIVKGPVCEGLASVGLAVAGADFADSPTEHDLRPRMTGAGERESYCVLGGKVSLRVKTRQRSSRSARSMGQLHPWYKCNGPPCSARPRIGTRHSDSTH